MNPIRYQTKICFGALFSILPVVACLSPQVAYGTESKSFSMPSPTEDMTAATFKMLASLAFVVGIIIVVFYLLRRLKVLNTGNQPGLKMKIVGSLPIAPKRSITVVEVAGKWLILGVGTESISLLCTMDGISESYEDRHSGNNSESSFHKVLRSKKALADQEKR